MTQTKQFHLDTEHGEIVVGFLSKNYAIISHSYTNLSFKMQIASSKHVKQYKATKYKE